MRINLGAGKIEEIRLNAPDDHPPVKNAAGDAIGQVDNYKYLGTALGKSWREDFDRRRQLAWGVISKYKHIWSARTGMDIQRGKYTKNTKYKSAKWEEKYPGIPIQIFSISSFGVLDSETLKTITTTWLPMLKDRGACFIRTLQIDLWFTAAKFLGTVLRIAQLGQS